MTTAVALFPSREPEDVIISRNGAVLGKKTVLKSDHFPGCQNKKLLPHVAGAPNYRQVGNMPVYGVAIPTVDGIRQVLDLVGCSKSGGRHVLWHNMREEPVIYINGRPFVLREVERPFTNLEYTGIDRARVEQMEMRLKEDVVQEASRYASKVMVSDELPDGQMVDQWEPIGPDSVQTPLEVYESLQAEGYSVRYERVPVTDEKSPKERDFDLLVQNLAQVDNPVAQVFNCQMGRGRTTTGMVVATLLHMRRTSQSRIPSRGGVAEPTEENTSDVPDTEEALRRGEYTVIRSLTRVLEGGVESKRQVDSVIDKCSAMQNLREAILQYRNNILRQADEKKRQAALTNFVEYLERYYFLICFAVYIHIDPSALEPRPRGAESGFQRWMRERPELYSVLRRLLRRDPMGALGYGPTLLGRVRRMPTSSSRGPTNDMGAVVGSRSGEVLGRLTCLKSDHCPGCQSFNLPDILEGAPNFRAVAGFPVYGVANPTLEGIRAVLARVGGAPGGSKVVWHNMREEPTVYINGKPFVLREVERPFKNMLEYTGIDRARVEKMEARLKEDVLREAERYEGAIMVNHETAEGEIFDAWEQVLSDGSSVQTPLEAYQSLQAEGYNVEYARMPITDGKAPKSRDFNDLAQRIAGAGPDTVFLFNCQMGRGRTTTGTVIATLVLTRCMYGRPLRPPPAIQTERSDQEESSSDNESPRISNVSMRTAKPPLPPQPVSSDVGGQPPPDPGQARSKPIPVPGQRSGPTTMEGLVDSQKERLSRSSVDSARGLDNLTKNYIGSSEGLDILSRYGSGSLGASSNPFLLDGESEKEAGGGDVQMTESGEEEAEGAARHAKRIFPKGGFLASQGMLAAGKFLSPSGLVRRKNMMKFTMEDIAIIRKITRLLERGAEVRAVLDAVIDRCASMQNIRRAILRYRRAFNNQDEDARVRQSALSRGVEYLERYYMLIAFTAYLESDAFDPGHLWKVESRPPQDNLMGFKAWIRRRPEIRQMKWSMRLRPARVFTIPEVDLRSLGDKEEGDAVQEAVVRSRTGQVLSRSTILKLYLFPGLTFSTHTSAPTFHGAHNVCKVEGFPVHGMATPTMEGAKRVLAYLGAAPKSEPASPRKAIVTDLREEAVVYVKGKPYVLREVDQPVSTLKHVGIEGPVVERLERRLKEDILEEASQMGGRILLHKELEKPDPLTGQTDIGGFWEPITAEDVATPAEMYAALVREGYMADYQRIPLTRERAPKAADLDAIQRRMDGAPKNTEYLFVSHTGYGGIAYAMAIVCLRLHAELQVAGPSGSSPSYSPSFPSSPASPTSHSYFSSLSPSALSSLKHAFSSSSSRSSSSRVSPLPASPFTDVGSPPSPRTAVRGIYPSGQRGGPSDPTKLLLKNRKGPGGEEEALRRGEYRDVLSLERVLVYGPASKFEVDVIIDRLTAAGRLRDDIVEHKEAMDACGEGEIEKEKRAAEAEMALKALRRYCYLIVFRAYLYARVAERGSTLAGETAFGAWMEARPELGHMVERLKLV